MNRFACNRVMAVFVAVALAAVWFGVGVAGAAGAKGRAPAVTKFQKLQSGFYVIGTGSLTLNLGSASSASNSMTVVTQGASATFPVTDTALTVPQAQSLPTPVHISKDTEYGGQPVHVDATVTIVGKGTLPDVYAMSASWVITDVAGNPIGKQVNAPVRTGLWKP